MKNENFKMSEFCFQDRLENTLNQIRQTLAVKAKEYVRNEDRMHNFNKGAVKASKTREQIIADYRLKHEVSVDDMREDIAKGHLPTKEVVEEKFGDIINYFILEKMSILHKIDEKEKTNQSAKEL